MHGSPLLHIFAHVWMPQDANMKLPERTVSRVCGSELPTCNECGKRKGREEGREGKQHPFAQNLVPEFSPLLPLMALLNVSYLTKVEAGSAYDLDVGGSVSKTKSSTHMAFHGADAHTLKMLCYTEKFAKWRLCYMTVCT